MAFLKLSVVFCSLFILQAQALPQSPSQPQSIVDVNTIISITEKIVTGVEHIVDDILDRIVQNLDRLIEQPNDVQKHLAIIFNKILNGFFTAADKQMNRFKERKNADTKIIVGCVQNEEEKVKSLILATFDKNSKCLVNELGSFYKSVQSIMKDLQMVQGDVKKSVAKLETCHGNDLKAVICALDVAMDTIKVVKEIPSVAGKDIFHLVQIVIEFPGTIKSCVRPNLDIFRKDIMEVIDEISTCARKQ